VLAARGAPALDVVARELGHSRALTVPMDVSSWDDNQNLVARALERFGRLDVVFANAGFATARGWLNDTPARWREMVLTNTLGVALTVRAALPALTRTSGQIVMTGSIAGREASPGSLYSATKWAVTGMAEAVRADLVDTGIRTTIIQPGQTDTPAILDPGRGILDAADVARAVMFALSQPQAVEISEIVIRARPRHDPSAPAG
jgi:NADP-dependent 3-hydroxy acid dehydrogenase YdfG